MNVGLVIGVVFALVMLTVSSCSVARKASRGGVTETRGAAVGVVFTDHERALVLGWFSDHRSGLPPGLAKRDRLPPGLEKQVRQRGTLPPGLQKRIHPLPLELEPQLRILHAGYVRVIVGATVVRMNHETQVIYDLIRNAVP